MQAGPSHSDTAWRDEAKEESDDPDLQLYVRPARATPASGLSRAELRASEGCKGCGEPLVFPLWGPAGLSSQPLISLSYPGI